MNKISTKLEQPNPCISVDSMESNEPSRPSISSTADKTSLLQTLVDMLQARSTVAAGDNGAVVLAQLFALRPDLTPWISDLTGAIDLILNGGRFTSIRSLMT